MGAISDLFPSASPIPNVMRYRQIDLIIVYVRRSGRKPSRLDVTPAASAISPNGASLSTRDPISDPADEDRSCQLEQLTRRLARGELCVGCYLWAGGGGELSPAPGRRGGSGPSAAVTGGADRSSPSPPPPSSRPAEIGNRVVHCLKGCFSLETSHSDVIERKSVTL